MASQPTEEARKWRMNGQIPFGGADYFGDEVLNPQND